MTFSCPGSVPPVVLACVVLAGCPSSSTIFLPVSETPCPSGEPTIVLLCPEDDAVGPGCRYQVDDRFYPCSDAGCDDALASAQASCGTSPVDARVPDAADVSIDAVAIDMAVDGAMDAADGGPPECLDRREVKMDLLLVVDNSGSMREEQESLAADIPEIVSALFQGEVGDVSFQPVSDLRVGVVSSDLGTGNLGNLCVEPNGGDDGRLLRGSGCEDAAPFLGFRADEGSEDSFVSNVACRTQLGTIGCGFEQQLDSMLKAVTPASSALRFTGATTTGNEDTAEQDFVRDDAILAIVMLTDEDDCSAVDPAIFRQDNSTRPELNDPRLNLRCSTILYGGDD
ncbi:MAG: hypothetical protein AAF938_15170, partial [Myxococcota bacterium]